MRKAHQFIERLVAISLGIIVAMGATALAQETIDRNFGGAASVSSTVPATVQGDILFASGTNVLSKLAKNTNATRYLSNSGTNNNPAWASVNLSNGVTGDLTGTTRSGSNYTLSGAWTWNTSASPIIINTTGPRVQTIENDAGTDLTAWDWIVQGGVTSFRTRTDADGTGKTWLSASRTSTTAIATVAIGNGTDNPAITVNGVTLTPLAGSFVATFDDACTTSPTVTFQYQKVGVVVTMMATANSGFTCTGDSTNFATTGTPVPAAIRPTSNASTSFIHPDFQDNGTSTGARIQISSAGNVVFSKVTTGTTSAAWTNSGTRTFYGNGLVTTYMTNN